MTNEFITENEAVAIDSVVYCEDFNQLNESGDLARGIGDEFSRVIEMGF